MSHIRTKITQHIRNHENLKKHGERQSTDTNDGMTDAVCKYLLAFKATIIKMLKRAITLEKLIKNEIISKEINIKKNLM